MATDHNLIEQDILRLYREPIVGANYTNTYGEENLTNLMKMYQGLTPEEQEYMREVVTVYSQSPELASSYVSVGVLHALGMDDAVAAAYAWAQTQENSSQITHHFDIGKSLADHFIKI